MSHVRAVVVRAAATRLGYVERFIAAAPTRSELLLLGQSRAALTELCARRTLGSGATFGLHRKTLFGLAAEIAMVQLAEQGLTIAPKLAQAAVTETVIRAALAAGELAVLGAVPGKGVPVARTPGFARALARTLLELDLADDESSADPLAKLRAGEPLDRELAALHGRYRAEMARQGLATSRDVLRVAARHVATSPVARLPLAIVDARFGTPAERSFVGALLSLAPSALVVTPFGDEATLASLSELGINPEHEPEQTGALAALAPGENAMAAFRARLFDSDADQSPPEPGTVTLQSAPGEALEAVEIARLILGEARAGVAFSDMAIVVRRGDRYATHLTTALARAGVPAFFEGGTRRPHPAGRAFLALLGCRLERGSGRRLIEYLSSAQLPGARSTVAAPALCDEALGRFAAAGDEQPARADEPAEVELTRLPLRRWERVLGEIGLSHAGEGVSIAAYLKRRLAAARAELATVRDAALRDATDISATERADRQLEDLTALELGLDPVLTALDQVRERAPLAELLAALVELARVSLKRPELVLALLAELSPLAYSSDEIDLDELVFVLRPRLLTLARPPLDDGWSSVLVTTAEAMRGRSRRVVVMPGLAERIVPEQPIEDPLLLDAARRRLPLRLATMTGRTADERLTLLLAAGAARERLHLTLPRAESETGRPRVPSFYALEALRAANGELPDLASFERASRPGSRVRATWPSPDDPQLAIDETEFALATIRTLFAREPGSVLGRARFLVHDHPHLERALRARFRRHDRPMLDINDGFVALDDRTKQILETLGLRERAYAPSSLEAFAACPYRFYLKALMRLSPRVDRDPIDRLDARLRGELYHRCQALLSKRLLAESLDPSAPDAQPRIVALAEAIVREVASDTKQRAEALIGQVFDLEMESLRLDLVGFVEEQCARSDGFAPLRAELGFGLSAADEGVRIRGRFLVRGAIDSIERDALGRLRITDYKTGSFPDELSKGTPAVGGGEMLQPLLYAMAADVLRGRSLPLDSEVAFSRLYFATRRGAFRSLEVAVAPDNLERAVSVLEAIDGAVGRGRLFALPREGACKACSYRPVCGPSEEARAKTKAPRLADRAAMKELILLRGLP